MSPTLHLDLSWILDVVERAGEPRPAPQDFGVALAAVERHRAVLAGRDVYGDPFARAAALAHTLGRLPWLERSNLRVAVAVAHGYLRAADVPLTIDQDLIAALATALKRPGATAADIADVLRTWRS
ncbi:prophage maintenance system killer protein [Kitasatospora sp. MAA4]|uniref:fic family toxin-antitoxin system, toxin component n=1 Tax=Kitasatospora sp. MAA4 TaxID=3035093 RepID=UPI0024749E7B|nr:fic family toxin-antitoxin system, toxin component [Kitasatospora sp. MAA4]MDH6135686.1 prophage maintenance system killer protein [Kitasatospora sp. MAA4]